MFADHDPKEIYKLHSYVNDTDDSSTNSDESDALLQFKPALYTYEELSDAIIIEPEGCYICIAKLVSPHIATSHYNSKKHKRNIAAHCVLNNLKSKQDIEAIVKEKIENLTLPDYCYICKANLMLPDNATSHYNSKRHKNNITVHRDGILNNLKSEQQESIIREKIENLTLPDFCHICKANLTTSENATSHYNSKKHKSNIAVRRDEILNNLKIEQQEAIVKEKIENLILPDFCHICKANLMTSDNATSHYNSNRHKSNIVAHRDKILNNLKVEQQEAIVKEKIENLTLPDYCYICKANLMAPGNATSHYNSTKHKSKIQAHRDEILNNLKSEQQATKKEKREDLTPPDYCDICKVKFISPQHTRTHYNSKRHKHNIELENNLNSLQKEAVEDKSYCCFVCGIELNSKELYDNHVQNSGHKSYSSVLQNKNSHETIVNVNSNDCNISTNKASSDSIAIGPVGNVEVNGAESALKHGINSSKNIDKSKYIQDKQEKVMSKSEQNLEATVKEKIEDLTPPDYCYICKVNLMSPFDATSHYNSKRHKRKIVVHRDEIINNLKSEKQKAVDVKSYCCLICDIRLNSKKLYNSHLQSNVHQLYASIEKTNFGHKPIINMNSNDCNITEGENETAACYNANEKEPVIDDLEAQEIKPVINNEEMLKINDTNQKEPVIDILELNNLKSEQQDLEAIVKEKIEDLTLPDYCYICKNNLTSPIHYNSKRHKRNIAVYRDELLNNLESEQVYVDLKTIVNEKIENLTLPDCCYICKANLMSPGNATSHYNSKKHKSKIALYRDKIVNDLKSQQREAVEVKSETGIQPGIDDGEKLEENNTNQKEPGIDILELNNLKSEQQDLEAILKEKLEDLTLPNYCYICKANLMTPGSATSHYNSKRHKRNIVVCRDEIVKNLKSEQQEAVEVKRKEELNPDINNGEMLEKNNINQKEPVIEILDETGIQPGIDNGEKLKKNNTNQKEPGIDILELNNLKSEQQDLKATKKEKREDLTPPDYCDICKVKFISPQHTKTHYNSKRHKHNIELENNLNSLQQEAVEDKSYCCFVCGIELNSKQLYDNHVQNSGHKSYSSVLQNKNSHETIVNVNSNDCNISTNKASSDSIAIGPVGNVEVNGAELALKHRINSSNNIDKSKYIQDKQEKVMSESEQDLEATVKEIIEDLTPPYYCYICKVNLMSPFDATSHYNSKKHKRKIVVHRDEIINNLKSEKQKAVDVKSYCCLICDIRLNSKKLYNSHLQSNVHQLYASIEKTNFGHKPIINMNSNDCNITEGENETTACYNANEKEPVIDDLETQEIKPIINNEEMLKINDTNQKEPVIDILELNNLKSEQQDLEAIVKEKNRGFDTTRLLLYMQK
ncbi:zinc finger homeobox protein 4-like isoform X2 [Sitophilus oryzae]|uniref:Zinc finger homeobox protein 4-like isoform X2 n=1 Tax=Sitophilus oryzae TaxID=7048 RepID=A0A6J2YUF4_SITOR|nr:zinc finger homeobox protein 4-like isoform X2 [Sitophilus oryzae]